MGIELIVHVNCDQCSAETTMRQTREVFLLGRVDLPPGWVQRYDPAGWDYIWCSDCVHEDDKEREIDA